MKHFTKFYYFASLLICFLFAAQWSYADGSKDLNPLGAQGNRAFLLSKTGTFGNVSDNSWPFLTQGTHYAYVKEGEKIAAASSAQGMGSGFIRLTSPTGAVYVSATSGTQTAKNVGRIFAKTGYTNREAELAGPRVGYDAFERLAGATEEGIWKIDFIAGGGESSSATAQVDVAADDDWTQATNNINIAAWDVSVRSKDDSKWITGRVYTNVFNFSLFGGNGGFVETKAWYAKTYVLTKDGVAYKVTSNGSNGVGFTFFVNNKGFYSVDKKTEKVTNLPSYKSLNFSSSTASATDTASLRNRVQDPRAADTQTDITHKIFYTKPALDLPKTAKSSGGGTTWLKNDELEPLVSDLSFFGSEGTENQAGVKGGTIRFRSNLSGSYRIEIDGGGVFPTRIITGLCSTGMNDVAWDGKGGKSSDPLEVGNPVPAGTTIGEIKVQLYGAEVHFPYIDMEINPGGISIERTMSADYELYSPTQDVIYWDDRNVKGGTATTKTNPMYSGINGLSSNANGHKWGTYATGASTGSGNDGTGSFSFGNEKSMDTWSYVPGNVVKTQIPIEIAVADLEVVSIVPSTTGLGIGSTITYTVLVRNNHDAESVSDVKGAKFGFNFPAGLTGVTVSAPVFSGTGTEASRNAIGATSFGSSLNLASGESVTYTITATVGAPLTVGSNIAVKATILRPNDVTDPDATSINNPTDPQTECDGTLGSKPGAGCNNIKDNTVVTILANPALTIVKTQTTGPNPVTAAGQIIGYRIVVTNTGGVPQTNVILKDLQPNGTTITLSSPVESIAAPAGIAGVLDLLETWTYNTTYLVTQSDIDNNDKLINTVTVTTAEIPAGKSTNVETPVVKAGKISLIKTVTSTTPVGGYKLGSTITYTFKVKNEGDVTLKTVVLTDDIAGVTLGAKTGDLGADDLLSVGEEWTYTGTYVVTQANVDAGKMSNTAKVTSLDPQNNEVKDNSGTTSTTDDATETVIPQNGKISLIKTVTSATPVGGYKLGSTITYTFKVKNEGDVTLKTVVLTDDIAGVTLGAKTGDLGADDLLSVGEEWTYTGTYVVTQANVDAGKMSNTAKVTSLDPQNNEVKDNSGTTSTTDDATETVIPQNGKISLIKTVTSATPVGGYKLGNTITYTFKVKNEGDVTLKSVVMTDDIAGVTLGAKTGDLGADDLLSVGEEWTYTGTYVVTQANVDAGKMSNTAKVTSLDPQNNEVKDNSGTTSTTDDATETMIMQNPALSLTKTAVVGVHNKIGDVINYKLVLKNTGNVTVTAIAITDANADAGSISPALIASLAPNATANITAKHTVTQADLDRGYVTNIAKADGKDPKGGNVHAESTDPTPIPGAPVVPGCTDCTVTLVNQAPALSLTKTAVVGIYNKVGDVISYNLVVKNTGNVTVTAIAITDANADAGSISPALIASLAPNATANITAKHTVTQADLDRGYVTNIAKADGKDPKGGNVHAESTDPTPIPGAPVVPGCTDCTVTPVDQAPALSLTKTAVVGIHNKVGDVISYNLVVKNTGNVTVTAIAITDANADAGSISPALIASLAPNATENITAKHTVTQADLDRGYVTNIAKADGKDPKGGNVHAESTDPTPIPGAPVVPGCTDCTVTPIDQAPALSLTKTAVVGVHNKIGDVISYNLVLKNTGNVTVTAIAITDANADAGSISPALIASLAPNATANITAKHTVTQADLDRGYVTNIAKADGKDPKGGNVHAESTDPTPIPGAPVVPGCTDCTVTPIDQTPALSLTKTAVVGVHNKIGDVISYNLVVKNTGNVTVTAIAITDANADAGSISPALIASLAPNATANITAKHTVTQADLDRGYVTNIAKADGKDPKGGNVHAESTDPTPVPGAPVVPGCTDCTVTPVDQAPSLSLTKTAVVGVHNKIGDVISYNLVLKNTGNVTVTAIAITDANADAGSITPALIANLAPNATANITAKHTVSQADLDRGYVTNIAKADGKDPKGGNVHAESTDPTPVPGTPVVPGCTDCTVTPVDQAPSLSLTKTAVAGTHNKAGDIIVYNLVVKNTGNVTVTAIAITDANADAGSITPALIANLAPNATVNITAKHTVTQADLDRGYVSNLAKADGKDPKGGNVHAESTDPNPIPGGPIDPACPKCTITPVEQKGAIALVKKVSNAGTGENGAFVLGNQIEYTFSITNTGNVSLKDLVLTDPLLNKPAISIPGILAPGQTVNHIEKYTITAADIAAGKVTNKAVINSTDPKGGNVKDESGTATDNDNPTVTVLAKPPVAKDDVKETQQNKPVIVEVQKNDEAGSSAIVPASTKIITQPKNGTVVVNADGTVTYTPNKGYTGTDEFTYTVTDKNGQISNPATVSLTVVPTKPTAIDDSAETQWNTEVKIPVTGNDKTDGAPFDKGTLEITAQPKHGSVKVNSDGTVTYLPNSGYTGTDTFTYRVKDENGNWTNIATVTVTTKGFFIPNVITPNGDGKNDTFVIVGLENYGNADVTIFNRWGNEVYRNNNYKNTWTGEGLNEGTYYYLIRLNNGGKTEVFKGWVLIKR